MDKENDLYYINLVIEGNTNAFAVLVDRYKDFVFTLSLKMLRNSNEAEESAQDTFIKVFRSLNSFKKESKFSTWLYKITFNNCLDRIKKQKRNRPIAELNEYTEQEAKSLMRVFWNPSKRQNEKK